MRNENDDNRRAETNESKEEARMGSIHRRKSKNKKKSKGELQGEQRKAVKEETETVDDLSEEVVVNINQQEDQENEIGDRNIV